MDYKEIRLTNDPAGHCLNSTQCFSRDDQWIVYDSRNEDGGIISAGEIAMVNTRDGRIVSLYKTLNQGPFGPGVGAASFSPVTDRVLFIHGIRNAGETRPYSFTRRTGVAIDTRSPFKPVFMDARSIDPPYLPGVLRGGTHAHSWSGDGQWISFTYNDYLLEQLEKAGEPVRDLRTIGVMAPGKRVIVKEDAGLENNSGELFALLIANVTENPVPGTDEIEKAFDECWVGKNGYRRADGSVQYRAIAFQGHLRQAGGGLKTEIFLADIPEDIVERAAGMPVSDDAASRPAVPEGIRVRRISFTEKGVSSVPRHWLRSTADGNLIGFLAEDAQGFIQLFGISPLAGEGEAGKKPRQLTSHSFSIQGPFNFSPDGRYVAYTADNSVWITEVGTGKSFRVSPRFKEEERPVGAVSWSNDGKTLCYNRRVETGSDAGGPGYLQIFLIRPFPKG
ncbi:MAG: DUF3748 domain-containing protein [Puia sp.]|nr:DUF3748 domain-containing protein [Puia sp.]